MDSTKSGQDQQTRCASCGQITPSYEIVNYGSMEHGSRQICRQCLNTEMAEAMGLEGFEHAKFEPVGLADCTGEVHEFHFRTNLFGPGVALDAFELRDGHPAGYQFQIIGDPEDDLLVSAWAIDPKDTSRSIHQTYRGRSAWIADRGRSSRARQD